MSEALVDAPKGLYAKAAPTLNSAVALKDRFPIMTCEDPHCTLIYSKEPAFHINLPKIDKDARFTALGTEITFFEGQEKEGYVVLLLKSEPLYALHRQFRAAGLVPTFPEYRPHVTLATPADIGHWGNWMNEQNYILAGRPFPLTFYYDGYCLLD